MEQKKVIQSRRDFSIPVKCAVCLGICLLYCLAAKLNPETMGVTVAKGMGVLLLLVFDGYVIYRRTNLGKKGQYLQEWIALFLFTGIVLRVGYTLYTPCTVRSHDLWKLNTESGGHASYVLLLLEGKLPQSTKLQFYQQPLFYLLGAGVSKVVCGVLGVNDPQSLVDASKLVSCMASCLMLFSVRDLCRELGLKEKGTMAAVAFMAFLPASILTSGRVGPDALTAYFLTLALLYTLRWFHHTNWVNTLLLALIYGLGVMTKVSVGVLAIFTAVLFLIKLIMEKKQGRALPLIGKFAAFGAISLPLGLWYNVRCMRRFGSGLIAVLDLGGAKSKLYCGNHSGFARYIHPYWSNLFATPYADPFEDFNLPVYMIKSSLFGEFKYSLPWFLSISLLVAGVVLSGILVWVLAETVVTIWRERKGNRRLRNMLLYVFGAFAVFYGSFVGFCESYPYGCSMDFRYMVFLIVPAGAMVGSFVERHDGRVSALCAKGALIAYGIMSVIWFLALGLVP